MEAASRGANGASVTDPPCSGTDATLATMGPLPTSDVTATLNAYLDELDRWTERLNLTSIPRDQMWARNVVEVQELLEVADPPAGSRVVDIGSGGGVPGLVVAILRPDVSVTLIDSDRRKTGFLIHAAGLLGLTGVVVEAIRAEDAGHRARLTRGVRPGDISRDRPAAGALRAGAAAGPGGRTALRAGRGRAWGAGGVRRGRVSVRRERS